MAIVSFWSQNTKETGQTLSAAAIATYMAIEHNYKILLLSTKFNDKTLESCFWDLSTNTTANITGQSATASLDSGIDGLSRAIASNRNSPEIVRSYSRAVLKDRLEVLFTTSAKDYNLYKNMSKLYVDALQIADKFYDIIFVDIDKGVGNELTQEILSMSNIIMVNLTQHQSVIDSYVELAKNDNIFNKSKILLLLGRYDKFSKFNVKNVTRYMGERKEPSIIPYNTLFFEACDEGKIVDYFLRFRNLDSTDRNALFINGVKESSEKIIYKLQELRMRV